MLRGPDRAAQAQASKKQPQGLPRRTEAWWEHPAYLPDACLLEELIPGHVEIHACPLSLGEEEEAVRNAGTFERE